jgi:peroxiredoxin
MNFLPKSPGYPPGEGGLAAMRKGLLPIFTIVICLVLSISACGKACPEIDTKAPDFTLKTIDGNSLSLHDFRGKPVIVNIWAIHCPACIGEMSIIQSVYDNWSYDGLAVLAINVQDSATAANDFMTAHKLTFTVMLDPQMEVYDLYCLPNAMPITLFINAKGDLKVRKVGSFRSQDEIESILRAL